MLPRFIVIGAMKAGTTSLFHHLRDHPEIYIHPKKELAHFVAREQGREPSRYEDFFELAPTGACCGDVSTQYTKYPQFPHVPERIRETVPDARLIYLVRDPVKRAISQYHHNLLVGCEKTPIDEALRGDPRYVAFSRYRMQISLYEPHFPREQILVVVLEELQRDPEAAMGAIFRHIGCDPGYVPRNLHLRANVSREQVKVSRAIRAIQSSRLYHRVQYRIPAAWKRRVVAWLGDAPPALPEASPGTIAWLEVQLSEDAAQLARWLGRREPIWRSLGG